IGFGRIGQLVAKRGQSFEMEVLAHDRFVAPERFRELGVEGIETTGELYDRSDFITIHLPKTPETVNWIDREAIAKKRDGAGIVTAEQVAAALNGGVVANAVNIAAVRPEEMEALAPLVPLCRMLGRLAQGLATGSVERLRAEFRGRIAEHDTRLLGIAVLVG